MKKQEKLTADKFLIMFAILSALIGITLYSPPFAATFYVLLIVLMSFSYLLSLNPE